MYRDMLENFTFSQVEDNVSSFYLFGRSLKGTCRWSTVSVETLVMSDELHVHWMGRRDPISWSLKSLVLTPFLYSRGIVFEVLCLGVLCR
jgi:phenylalanine-4-hydroxylase